MKPADLFADIRPYHDDEVPAALERLMNDDELLAAIAHFRFPRLSRFLGVLLKPMIRRALHKRWALVRSVRDVQTEVAHFMEQMIASTTQGVTYSGLEHLESGKSYLFISNHRDIAMDPAFVNWGLYKCGLDTVRIAIGDNLLRKPCATELMRLNKSFIVKRSAKGPREMMKAFSELSAYIAHSLQEGSSIWIAQKEGRAKDGDDRTDPAILKMFYMAGKHQKIPFADYMQGLNIVPVAISYEFDPGDEAKARELVERAQSGSYEKGEFEDIDSIVAGIVGFKGRVHVSIGSPLSQIPDTPEALAESLDRAIHGQYRLFPSNLLAAGESQGISEAERQQFANRIAAMPSELQSTARAMYARPVLNQRQSLEN
ncbi:1-acyl-sn-glycerol-3-phosphate acyltransferase [Pseudaeromonas sharmana]|uniref:1-acyl-sn-glycerol-3-phosphate acyltransferase n=1 Tax=Pseudaeromonas sharmana TaxID=328412 RepID=A0ABV8CSN3_9GAMM